MASYVLRQRSGSRELSERLSDQPAEECFGREAYVRQCVGGGDTENQAIYDPL